MAQPERHGTEPHNEYRQIVEGIIRLPEAHQYTVTDLVPFNMEYEIVGFMAAFPPIHRGSENICVIKLYTDAYCGTVLLSRLMALNGDRQTMDRLRENPGKRGPLEIPTPTILSNQHDASKLPKAIVAFYAATEQLSTIKPEIALLTPPGADKMQAYDRLLRLSYGILANVLPANSHNQ